MKIPFSPPDIGEDEINAVAQALRSGWITTGPKTKKFENMLTEFCGSEKTACFDSCSAALEMTLRVLGVGAGDEVIVPAYTYTATASVVCHVGAVPVLIDCASNSLQMDYDKLASLINERTKVVIPVDVGGVPCDYDKVFSIVRSKKNIFVPKNALQKIFGRVIVLADSAHSLGAKRNGKRTGSLADFTAFSFHAVKNLTTAEGGAVTWKRHEGLDSNELYKSYMLLSLHGQSKDALSKTKLGAWEYDIIGPYFKCNMTDIAASIGIVQLGRFSSILKSRKKIIEFYNKELYKSGVIVLQHYTENFSFVSSGHLYITKIVGKNEKYRNMIIEKMADHGVAVNVHYKPLPMFTAYKNMGFDIKDFPNAYNMYKNELTLPLYSKMTMEEAAYVIECYKKVLNE